MNINTAIRECDYPGSTGLVCLEQGPPVIGADSPGEAAWQTCRVDSGEAVQTTEKKMGKTRK